MNKLTRKIASIITAAAVAFASVGVLPDIGVFPSLVVPASAESPYGHRGSGTADDPWQIATAQEWQYFAHDMVNTNNSTYGDDYYKLTADITVTTNDTSAIFVGDSTRLFRGHFDGDGHTLTFNYSGSRSCAAPFSYVNGATIENLKVAGGITAQATSNGADWDAGIVGCVKGNTTITNCTSSVELSSSSSKNGSFGGLVGKVESGATLNISNCVFNGSMTGSISSGKGCFVGFNNGTVNITDCLSDPVSLDTDSLDVYSFVRDKDGTSSLTHAYRTWDSPDPKINQGIRVYTEAPADKFSKKIQIFTGDHYWQPGTAAITGVESSYPLIGDSLSLPTCGVTFDSTALNNSDYTVTVKNSNDQVVGSITAEGTYTLTVTGKGDYGGSVSKTFKVYSISSIPYIDAAGAEKETNSATRLESATLPEGDWWYVTGETTINSRISISGTKHLILTDGAVLNIPKGIQLSSGNTLNIYGQSGNTGKLVINGVESENAGIGGNEYQSCGTLTVNGGDITVTGGSYGAGIGGGYSDNGNAHGGTVTINGGNVTAKGGSNGAYFTVGIGGGGSWKLDHVGGNGGTIVINGGIVSATGFKGCAGMGGGRNCADKGTVTINWKNASDRVYASSYNSTVTVSGDYVHEGTSTKATSENIGGKTLVPAKKITIGSVTNGTIALPNDAESGSYFGIGSTVTLNVAPDISYATDSVKYGATEIVPVSGVYSFVMPANDVTVTATFVYDPSHFSVNEAGTEYTIHDSTGWEQFCKAVNGGADFAGKTVILDNSISVSTTAGTADHKFKGTFDGGSKTLTFNKTGVTTDNCAPFLYVDGATVKNLNIAGSITTSKKYAASLAAHTYGTTNITNCHSTVTITGNISGDGTHGGFVAVNEGSATLNFTGCSFKGSMLGSSATSNGGFVGYNSGTKINYTDCLFASATITMSGTSSCTFNRNGKNSFTRAYYTQTFGTAEGTQVYTTEPEGVLSEAVDAADGKTYYVIIGLRISTADQWNTFASEVNGGKDYAGLTVYLSENISVSTTVGTSDHKFKGTFDGGGNTITFNKTNAPEHTALFAYIDGATIKDLTVAGEISSSEHHHLAALISENSGTSYVTDVIVSAAVTCTASSNQYCGGFATGGAGIKFTRCVYNGQINVGNSSGGFCGWGESTTTFADCLFAPAENSNISSGGNFCNNNIGTVTNSYYTLKVGSSTQGKQAYTVTAANENVSAVLAENSAAGVSFSGTIYAGAGDTVSLTLSNTPPSGKTFSSYTASAGTLTGTENPYTLAMPASDVTVSATFVPAVTVSMNLTIMDGSEIGANFMFELADGEDEDDFTVEINGESNALADLKTGSEYKYKLPVVAKKMRDDITVIVKKNGTAIKTTTTSVYDYANIILADNTYSSFHPLIRAMLNYGAYSQSFFGYNTGSLANEGITDNVASVDIPEKAFDKAAFNDYLTTDSAPVTYYGMNLTLESKTLFTLHFDVNEGHTMTEALDYLKGFTISGGDHSVETIGGRAAIRFSNIHAYDLLKTFTVGTFGFSTDMYMNLALANGSTELKALCKALYAFYTEAHSYSPA